MHGAGYESPEAAEAAFYDAFERRDIDAMTNVWDHEAEVSCIHPGGSRLDDIDMILESWRAIFKGGQRLRFERTDVAPTTGADVAVHCLYEVIRFGERFEQQGTVVATNVYRRTERGWRMVIHHASPDPSGVTQSRPEPRPVRVTIH